MTEDNISVLKLNQHLSSLLKLDVDTAFNVIYNSVVKWVHQIYNDRHEYQIIYDKYMELTRNVIRQNQYDRYADKTNWLETFPQLRITKDANDEIDYLLSSLNQMPTETVVAFLSELTAAWCLSCPRETAKQYLDDVTVSDVDLANTLFSWLLRPFDFFE
jgi:hypothetical protein